MFVGCSRASLYVRQYDRSHTASLPGRNAGPGRDVATAVPEETYPLIRYPHGLGVTLSRAGPIDSSEVSVRQLAYALWLFDMDSAIDRSREGALALLTEEKKEIQALIESKNQPS